MTVIASAVRESSSGTSSSETSVEDLAWTEVGPGLWVAKCGADFAGLIEKLWGAGYRATDHRGKVVGEFASLVSAKKHVNA